VKKLLAGIICAAVLIVSSSSLHAEDARHISQRNIPRGYGVSYSVDAPKIKKIYPTDEVYSGKGKLNNDYTLQTGNPRLSLDLAYWDNSPYTTSSLSSIFDYKDEAGDTLFTLKLTKLRTTSLIFSEFWYQFGLYPNKLQDVMQYSRRHPISVYAIDPLGNKKVLFYYRENGSLVYFDDDTMDNIDTESCRFFVDVYTRNPTTKHIYPLPTIVARQWFYVLNANIRKIKRNAINE